jgi:nicotinamidase-related amidase
LKARLGPRGVPCIYVNDNFGDWTSEFSALVRRCARLGGPAGEVSRVLAPAAGDLSVLKPRHSGFFETPLGFLLQEMGVSKLILTGIAADMCVLSTAQDAHVRQFDLWIPADCVAAFSAAREKAALALMARTLGADPRRSVQGRLA